MAVHNPGTHNISEIEFEVPFVGVVNPYELKIETQGPNDTRVELTNFEIACHYDFINFEKNEIRDDTIMNSKNLDETNDYWQYLKCVIKIKFDEEAAI